MTIPRSSLLALSLALHLYGFRPHLPLAFEPNRGQADPAIRFLSRGDGYGLFLTGPEAILALRGRSAGSLVRVRLVGAAAHPTAVGVAPLASKSHYFLGADRRRWRSDVPNYSRVRFSNVYPGIDLVYYGNQGRLEFDFLVTPGADAGRIRLQFAGAEGLRIDAAGDLLIDTPVGVIRQCKPRVLQDGRVIDAAYAHGRRNTISVRLARYDASRPLNIDPVLVYSSYLGGDAAATGGSDYGRAVAVDASGNIYLAGSTESTAFPVTRDAAQSKPGGAFDAFVMKLDPAGNCVYATYLGGEYRDEAFAIAVDPAGNAYAAGSTSSLKFPVTSGALQTTLSGYSDGFVTKLDPSGAVVYSTLLGGGGAETINAIAVAESGEAYLAGSTNSVNFPVTSGASQSVRRANQTAFVAKLDASGTALLYATYLGGSSAESAAALAVDASGNAFVVGQTLSRDFPVTPDAYRTRISLTDAFVAKLNDSGTALVYATLLGGGDNDVASAVAVDGAGNVYVAGSTASRDLPVTKNARQASYGGGSLDGFVAKLNDKGTALLYCAYLGGAERDAVNAMALQPDGALYVAGETHSADFPVSSDAVQGAYGGGTADGFLTVFSSADMAGGYSTFLGGGDEDRILAVAVDPSGAPRLTGYTASGNFPCTQGAAQTGLAPGGYDAFLAGFEPGGTRLAFSTYIGGSGYSTQERALDMAVDRDGAAYVTGQTFSTNFPSVEPAQPVRGGGTSGDAFVAKIAPDGKSLVYSTYLGGSGNDIAMGIAVEGSGSAYVTGTTSSANFPTSNGAYQTALKGASNVFVAKLSPSGNALVYCTLVGGSGSDSSAGIAIDSSGNAYVTGSTYSPDFPVTTGALQTVFPGFVDAFVGKLNADGSALVYSTFLGGRGPDSGNSIAVDADGKAYVTGSTSSSDFPATPGALAPSLSGAADAFVAKLDPAGSSLEFATFLGGGGSETGRRIILDGQGNVLVAGGTGSSDFPVTSGAAQAGYGGGGDGFIAKLQPDGASLAYATYLGGVQGEEILGLAVDSAGNAYVAGYTGTFAFPSTPDRFQTGLNGNPDAFLAKLDANGKTLLFSSQYGFSGGKTYANAIAVDVSGKVYLAGQTSSPNLRTTPGAFQTLPGGPVNAFLAKFDLDVSTPVPSITKVVNYVTQNAPVCGGGIVTILGQNLATDVIEYAKPLDILSGALPTRLGTTVVRFGSDSRAIPLFSASPEKIVAQLPFAALDTYGELTVTVGSDTSKAFRPELSGAAFGIFVVYKQDLSQVSQANYLKPGDVINVLVTGFGKTNPAVATGAPAPAQPLVSVRYDASSPYVSVSQPGINMKCDVTSMTLIPGMVGVAQAAVRIGPVSSDNTQWDLVFGTGGIASNKVPLWIQSAAP